MTRAVASPQRPIDRGLAPGLTQIIRFTMNRKEYRAVARIHLEALSFSAHTRTWYRLFHFMHRNRNYLRRDPPPATDERENTK